MSASSPIQLHPENPRYLLFRGRPWVLLCATEHYGSVINRAFDFARYLDEAADKRQTLTRLFLLFRELQTARNPGSPCKPESPDYVAPWVRAGPGLALDGEPRYDLDRWNEEFFARLRRFLTLAAEREIVVEVTLFSNTYADTVWALNPLRAANNLSGVGDVPWTDYNTLREPGLVERQKAYVRRVVAEINEFDNFYFELCNEPGGGYTGGPAPDEVDAWQQDLARVVRDEEERRPKRHLLFWSQAFRYHPTFEQRLDASFGNPLFDAVNVHPLPDLVYRDRRYQQGRFMAKDLKLREIRDFCLASGAEPKPCVLDEDNSASLYRDEVGWTIHRKRAWTALLSGCHYDYIDFSIGVGREAGTEESRRQIRSWMCHLSEFIRGFDVVHARPDVAWLAVDAPEASVTGLAVAGTAYAGYVADAREFDQPGHGEPIGGGLHLSLPPGRFHVAAYSPVAGQHSPAIAVAGGAPVTLELPLFRHDLAILVRRAD
jgi:Family of unknown function (DUF6298)